MTTNVEAFIAKQALRIDKLEETLRHVRDDVRNAQSQLVCVGGPLNDNVLGFSKEQLHLLRRINGLLESALESADEAVQP